MTLEKLWEIKDSSVETMSLNMLAQEIESEHANVISTARATLEHAIKCGYLLFHAKRKVKHGSWLQWLRDNTSISDRTARFYMQVSREVSWLKEYEEGNILAGDEKVASIADMREAGGWGELTLTGVIRAVNEVRQERSRILDKAIKEREREEKFEIASKSHGGRHDYTPEAKQIVEDVVGWDKQLRKQMPLYQDAVRMGKLSPEAKQFISNKLRKIVDNLEVYISILEDKGYVKS